MPRNVIIEPNPLDPNYAITDCAVINHSVINNDPNYAVNNAVNSAVANYAVANQPNMDLMVNAS